MKSAYTQEPNAVALNFPALRERRDPDFMRDMREYSETVCWFCHSSSKPIRYFKISVRTVLMAIRE